ncbi:MAG: hypothetical protein ACRD26_12645 [Vicinamibacterales bacterium]
MGLTLAAAALAGLCALAVRTDLRAQDVRPFVESPDTLYYDFWVGRWADVTDGSTGAPVPVFIVTRGIHAGSLEETWSGVLKARAFRTWDKTASRWMHVWVSDNGLFQVWEGRKVGRDWYMFKDFDIDGDRYLSRQAILPRGDREAERVSERSDDGGRTWTLRFRQRLRRIE